jgi:hypothetical protein
MSVQGARQAITNEVTGWPGVTAHRHRFGGVEYCLGERREIGHTHGDAVVDIPFPAKLRDELIAAGRAKRHQARPEMGAVSFFLREPADVQRAIDLLRLSYDLALKQKAARGSTAEA